MGALTLRIGTRGSALARFQTRLVADLLQAAHPDVQVETVIVNTEGDRTQHTNRPVGDWGQGVFVKELESALLDGQIDLAVHSLKDVPPRLPDGLALLAIPERVPAADVLLTADGRPFEALARGARVGTSSARRCAFLRARRPDLQFLPIRGNVDTRIRKLHRGEYDAIVLAQAGLDRLGIQVPRAEVPSDVLPPAPGQGALAVQGRADDARLSELLQAVHHPPSAAAVTAERRLMRDVEGGCRLPMGALAAPLADGGLSMLAAVAAPDGSRTAWVSGAGSQHDPEELGARLGAQLLAEGAADLMAASVA